MRGSHVVEIPGRSLHQIPGLVKSLVVHEISVTLLIRSMTLLMVKIFMQAVPNFENCGWPVRYRTKELYAFTGPGVNFA